MTPEELAEIEARDCDWQINAECPRTQAEKDRAALLDHVHGMEDEDKRIWHGIVRFCTVDQIYLISKHVVENREERS